jgi:hypothetical protein
MLRLNHSFVISLGVPITRLLDSTKPKHSNTKLLDWDLDLFVQLQIRPTF